MFLAHISSVIIVTSIHLHVHMYKPSKANEYKLVQVGISVILRMILIVLSSVMIKSVGDIYGAYAF